ncbi:MAG TPA: FecR domain-containing protein [Methylophilaceae bacterium]|nr:FecR domain-containing protein [Methylophilaceae bacterium]
MISTLKKAPVLVFMMLLAASIASAEPGYKIHTVTPGDTLEGLAKQYTGTIDSWREIQRHNNVKNPRRLEPGSQLLVPLPSPTVTVVYVEGEVQLLTEGQAQPLEIGAKLQEEARVSVGKNSYLSLQFADGSVVRVMSDSVVRLAQVREQSKPAVRKLELESGTLDISVTPQQGPKRKSRSNTFEVITPGAVAAVRGTRFDVVVDDDRKTSSSVTEGVIGVSSNDGTTAATGSKVRTKKTAAVTVKAGFGIPVTADGQLGETRALLPPVALDQLQSRQSADFVTFEWPALANAKGYLVSLAENENPDHVLRNIETGAPNVRFSGLANGTHVLSVRAIDRDNILGMQAHQPVEVKTAPAYPLYIQPAPGQKVGSNTELVCTPVAGAVEYHLQVSSDPGFNNLVADADGLSDCRQFMELPPGQHYWRVAAKTADAEGNLTEGPYSSPASFEVEESSEIVEAAAYPTLFWMDDGLRYTAQISKDEGFSTIVRESEVSGNSIGTEGLEPGSYYIRLRAMDETGMTGNITLPRQFEIQSVDSGGGVDRTWFDKAK